MSNISIAETIKELKRSRFFLECALLPGYVDALPVVKKADSKIYLVIPFIKYKMTGEVDKTLVYPIRYTVTVELPSKKIVGFSDLSSEAAFSKVDFEKPVGFFRHDAIKNLTRKEYKDQRNELYAMYSELVDSALQGKEYDSKEFSALLTKMVEPSLLPIYKWIDGDFYANYLG